MSFLNWPRISGTGSLYLLNLKILMTISSSKENTDRTWYDMAIQICKISVLYVPNPPLTRSKRLGDYLYYTFEHFWKISEYSEVGWLLLMSLDKAVQEKDGLREFKFPTPEPHKLSESFYVCREGDPNLLLLQH